MTHVKCRRLELSNKLYGRRTGEISSSRSERLLNRRSSRRPLNQTTSKEKNDRHRTVVWHPRPQQLGSSPRKNELFHVQFRLSAVVTEISDDGVRFCAHVRDSLRSHVVLFDPVERRTINPCCRACERTRNQSCSPLFAAGRVQTPPTHVTLPEISSRYPCSVVGSIRKDDNTTLTLPFLRGTNAH